MALERPSSAQKQPSKLRWGELEEDDGEDLDFLLPPRQVIGPDNNGIKKVIEYRFNDDGHKVKITTTTQVRKLAKARFSKRAIERRGWAKFGDGVHEDVGSRLTMVSTEEILLERPRPPGSFLYLYLFLELSNTILFRVVVSWEIDAPVGGESVLRKPCLTRASTQYLGSKGEEKAPGDIGKGGAVLRVCRTCGKKGDHWTSRCPYKDLAPSTESFVDKPPGSDTLVASGGTKGVYMRKGAERPAGSDMRRRNEESSVRVTNLSEDTREPDLLELFRAFGPVIRVYVAIDQKTGVSRGFGFVNFVNKEDAQRAIVKLNGYGYDNLILRVEWATPRT
ncbi:hypothetical protein OSB04_025389 [Centaurea solstitialis]|uniref:Eukaryotic translation initiation factor 3 subunit G n=1 Tax=Centaurea solstitialis TaxID=347529 RepID=A0AA38T6G9_9ASTR|nr:hypothetical protein OSB04_025389 [Centaurea solstitialis]